MSLDVVNFATSDRPARSRPIKPELVTEGSPVQTQQNVYRDTSRQLWAGIWECTVGKWSTNYEGMDEVCHIISGRVALFGPEGERHEFGPGDSYVIPAGFKGIWEVLEPVKKLYVVYAPLD